MFYVSLIMLIFIIFYLIFYYERTENSFKCCLTVSACNIFFLYLINIVRKYLKVYQNCTIHSFIMLIFLILC